MFPKIRGTPKSSILIGFSIINHPFWGYPYFRKYPYILTIPSAGMAKNRQVAFTASLGHGGPEATCLHGSMATELPGAKLLGILVDYCSYPPPVPKKIG